MMVNPAPHTKFLTVPPEQSVVLSAPRIGGDVGELKELPACMRPTQCRRNRALRTAGVGDPVSPRRRGYDDDCAPPMVAAQSFGCWAKTGHHALARRARNTDALGQEPVGNDPCQEHAEIQRVHGNQVNTMTSLPVPGKKRPNACDYIARTVRQGAGETTSHQTAVPAWGLGNVR
jgi:hypothetical protein